MPNVIALAFHVDYWDGLGWRDPFAIPPAVGRQRSYVRALGLSSAFTPQAVIDGRISVVGSDKRQILAAMADAAGAGVAIGLEAAAGTLTVALPEVPARSKYTIFLAACLPRASTTVGRGENSGHTLEEFNIVREFRTLGTWSGKAAVLHVPLQSLPSDATKVAVFLQTENQGPIVGSAAIALR